MLLLLLLLLPLLLLPLGGSQYSSLYYRLQVPQSVTVEEGLCTSIPCTFYYYSTNNWIRPFHIHGYWFKSSPANSNDDPVATTDPTIKVKKWAKGRFHLVGDPVKDNCSLRITDAQRNDTGRYFFRMERGNDKYNYLHFQVHLNVTALTKKPNIYVPGILEVEHSITVLCAATWICVESTNLTFSWIGASLSREKLSRELPFFSELTLIPRPQDHGTNLTCQVTFPRSGVSTERTVQLNVTYPLKSISISVEWESITGLNYSSNNSSHSILKEGNLRLLCQADNNSTAMLSWAHGGRQVLSSQTSDSGVLVLELPRIQLKDGGQYSCKAQQRQNILHASFNLTVLYAPENLRVQVWEQNRTVALLKNASSLVVLMGESLHLECAADSSPLGNVSWAKGSQDLTSSLLSTPGMSGLKISHINPEDGGEYTCQAQNPWGTSHIILKLSVHRRTCTTFLTFSIGILLGAGIMALLILILTLIYKKCLRKKQLAKRQPETSDSKSNHEEIYHNLEMNQDRDPKPPPRVPVTQAPPEELNYASLNFRRLKPQDNLKNQEAYSEYTEIKY